MNNIQHARKQILVRFGLPVALPACLLVFVAGCGGAATVDGRITYQGKPVVYGSVIIESADHKSASGRINPDGTFTVEGVRPGDVRIGVISRDPAKGRSARRTDKALAKEWVPLPRKYEDPARSGITSTVGSGHVHCDLDL